MVFLLSLFLSAFLSGVILFVGGMISSKMEVEKESGSAYECGFESEVSARVPFSLQFFMIGVIFLIFDVEIVLMLPVPLTLWSKGSEIVLLFFFIFLLLLGLFFEWVNGALEWKK
uniref:NADH-ubiquinone oxidoreductase chain 3 n=1 Tax=Buthus occitanus TaxID=6868 RepID=B2CKW3_BUTOI|nr:NADH dehydrogenase subunit 3 [Buthus occitanus]ACA66071.1 NADH dehydrogenase subunit 3 [Buthus occitanus]